MSDREIKEFGNTLDTFKEEVTKNRDTARAFLVDLGVFTEKGNLRRNYKNLCIPEDQV